jgi:hypothetical protein
MNMFDFYRLAAGGSSESFCIGVDFGQSVDPCAIAGMVRLELPDPQHEHEFVSAAPVEEAPGQTGIDK